MTKENLEEVFYVPREWGKVVAGLGEKRDDKYACWYYNEKYSEGLGHYTIVEELGCCGLPCERCIFGHKAPRHMKNSKRLILEAYQEAEDV